LFDTAVETCAPTSTGSTTWAIAQQGRRSKAARKREKTA
jgi:hypothetical protein